MHQLPQSVLNLVGAYAKKSPRPKSAPGTRFPRPINFKPLPNEPEFLPNELAYTPPCGPCKIKMQDHPFTEEDDPYDTFRCWPRCEGKWKPTLIAFTKYLLEDKFQGTLNELRRQRIKVEGVVAVALLYHKFRRHDEERAVSDGLIWTSMTPTGRLDTRVWEDPKRVRNRDLLLHFQIILQADMASIRQMSISSILLKRRTYNVTLEPHYERTPRIMIDGVLSKGLAVWPAFHSHNDDHGYCIWAPRTPEIHARLYSKYGEADTHWTPYSWHRSDGSGNQVPYIWHYGPGRKGRKYYDDDLGEILLDEGEKSPRR